jgi:hypothetical protein
MNREELIVNSIVELSNLNEHASGFEKQSLITGLNYIAGDHYQKCAYGLMTGSCFNLRALNLKKSCCSTRTGASSLENLLFNYKSKAIDLIRHYIKI